MKIGLIGYGYWGGGFVARNIARVADLAVIVDPDPSRMVSASEAWAPWGVRVASEPEVAFRECDAVWVATPVDTHAGLVEAALDMGCHVMCEKPFTLSSVQADTLAATAEANDLALMVGHLSLYTAAHQKARELSADLQVEDEAPDVQVLRQTDRASISDKSVVWGLGPHDVASLLDMFGLPSAVEWSGTEHRAVGKLLFSNASATVKLDWLGAERVHKFVINGDDAAAEVDKVEPLLVEAQSFVDLCNEAGPAFDRERHRWMARKTTDVLELAEERSWRQ